MSCKIRVILCFSLFPSLLGGVFGAENEIVWNSFRKQLSLNAQDTTLVEVLGGIQRETGWQVRLQPGLNRPVSVKFKTKPVDEALRFLLGDLRYTLTARPGEPGKLEVGWAGRRPPGPMYINYAAQGRAGGYTSGHK